MAALADPGTRTALTPEAVAIVQSPAMMAREARWYATRDDEQAVLVGTHGPTRPSVYDTRPDMKANPFPERKQTGAEWVSCSGVLWRRAEQAGRAALPHLSQHMLQPKRQTPPAGPKVPRHQSPPWRGHAR